MHVRFRLAVWLVVWLSLAVVLWQFAGPGLVQRELSGRLEIGPGASDVSVQWTTKGNPTPRGAWIEPDTTTNAPTQAVDAEPVPDAAPPFRVFLPSYRLRSLVVQWKAEPGAWVRIENPILEFRLLGFTVLQRAVGIEPISGVERADDRWISTDAGPTLRLVGRLSLGTMGVLFVTLAIGSAVLGAATLAIALPILSHRRWFAPACVWTSVAAVTCWVALVVPCCVTSDGMDYIDAADWLVATGSFAKFVPYKAPALALVVAGAMAITPDFLIALAWIHAVMGIGTAALAYAVVRRRAGRSWALAAALVVGLHPVLLTYHTYLLRESLAALCFTAIAVAVCWLEAIDRRSPRSLAAWCCIVIGLLIAFGSHVRENFQLLILFLPVLAVAIGGAATPWLVRIGRGAGIAVVAVAMVLPWSYRNYAGFGAFGIVSPKLQINRALNAWSNGVADGNDTAIFSREQLDALRAAQASGKVSDYDFVGRVFAAERDRLYAGAVKKRDVLDVRDSEAVSRSLTNEALARHPLRSTAAVAAAFMNQLGLWNFYDIEGAPSNEWWSRPIRGRPFPYKTNFCFNYDWDITSTRKPDDAKRLKAVFDPVQAPTAFLQYQPWTRPLNEWFWVSQAMRPVIAIGVLACPVLAWRRGDRAIFVAAMLVLLSIAITAITVAAPSDRFAVPFLPVMVCAAAYTAAAIAQRRTRLPLESGVAGNPPRPLDARG
ncbi:MAG: hypothetical protein KF745_02420 [Phycisphaeraceae bacterium]|nr:hypothetical protein [Phycisphaeraceae bacterium]